MGSDLSDDGDGPQISKTSITSDGEVLSRRLALVSKGRREVEEGQESEIGEVRSSTDVVNDEEGRESAELPRQV